MKKLLLVLSVLSVVGLQAAESVYNPKLTAEQIALRKQLKEDRATIITMTLDDGTEHKESVWSLQSKYNLMFALVKSGSLAIDKHDEVHMKVLIKHRPKSFRDARSLVDVACQAKVNSPKEVFNYKTGEFEDSAATKNYKFLQSLQTEDSNASGFEVV